jgi:hypothetical protein
MEYLDKPLHDGTANAHPAYWRGKAQGINDVLKIVSDIMLGHDNGSGTNNNRDIEAMRRGLLVWREQIDKSLSTKKEKVEK